MPSNSSAGMHPPNKSQKRKVSHSNGNARPLRSQSTKWHLPPPVPGDSLMPFLPPFRRFHLISGKDGKPFAPDEIVFPDPEGAKALLSEANQAIKEGRPSSTIIPLLDDALRLDYFGALDGGVAELRADFYSSAGLHEPQRSHWLYSIGVVFAELKLWREADAVYQAAADLDPLLAWHLNNLAWMTSTAPDVRAHSGQYAVIAAAKACEISGWGCWCFIGTLAAAFARAGDFQRAAEWQRISLRLAPDKQKAKAQEMLRHFEAGQAYVEYVDNPVAGGSRLSEAELAELDVEALMAKAKELIGTPRSSVQ